MVLGNGLIAKSFVKYSNSEDVLIFASGVSNSKETEDSPFLREFELLKKTLYSNPDKLFVYFSTCSIEDLEEKNSKYVQHKLAIEKYISSNTTNYLIFRVSNILAKSENKSTIVNYLYNAINDGTHINVWENSKRNLIDIETIVKIISYIIDNKYFQNEIINVSNSISYNILDIICIFEKLLCKKANYSLVSKGSFFNVSIHQIEPILKVLKIDFTDNYLEKSLYKYFINS